MNSTTDEFLDFVLVDSSFGLGRLQPVGYHKKSNNTLLFLLKTVVQKDGKQQPLEGQKVNAAHYQDHVVMINGHCRIGRIYSHP